MSRRIVRACPQRRAALRPLSCFAVASSFLPGPRAFLGRLLISILLVTTLTLRGGCRGREPRHRRPDRRRSSGSGRSSRRRRPEGANYVIIGSGTRAFVGDASDAAAFGDTTTEHGGSALRHLDGRARRTRRAEDLGVSFPATSSWTSPGSGSREDQPRLRDRRCAGGHRHPRRRTSGSRSTTTSRSTSRASRRSSTAIGYVRVFLPGRTRDPETGLNTPYGGGCCRSTGRPPWRTCGPATWRSPTRRADVTRHRRALAPAGSPGRPRPHRPPTVVDPASSPVSRSRRASATRSSRWTLADNVLGVPGARRGARPRRRERR